MNNTQTPHTPPRRYFGTDGVRGRVGGEVINAEFVLRLGYAAGRVLTRQHAHAQGRPAVLIGKDTRLSGYMLESALEAGLACAGVDVLLVGPVPTPAVAYLTRALRLAAGIVISASHNPYFDNGIKFFSGAGMKLADDIEHAIEQHLDEPPGCVASEALGRARRIDDATGRYIEFCKSSFPKDLDLSGWKIVIDAAHGAAYQAAPQVFRELGAEVHTLGCQPNGLNINEGVGALHPENLAEQVVALGADVGIALDGDADRLIMVDAGGQVHDGDALLYAIVKSQTKPVAGVVGTLMTNFGLEQRLRELNIGFERANVGDRYVLEKLLARGWQLGGESSGHILCLDKHSTGDGIIAALQVLAGLQRKGCTLADQVSDLRMYPQKMVNVALTPDMIGAASNPARHPKLQAAVKQVEAMLGGRGRVLVRASGTEPKLRLMVEAEDATLIEQGLQTLLAVDLAARE